MGSDGICKYLLDVLFKYAKYACIWCFAYGVMVNLALAMQLNAHSDPCVMFCVLLYSAGRVFCSVLVVGCCSCNFKAPHSGLLLLMPSVL